MPAPSLLHTFSIKLPAAPARVFAALTEPAELQRWFAEHAHVEPRVGGAYQFHGPAALGTASPAEATQQLLAIEPGVSLRYRWTLHGVPSEVTYRLEAAASPASPSAEPSPSATSPAAAPEPAPECQLHITHEIFGELPFASPRYAVDDLWRLVTGNLTSHLAGDGNVALPDFTRTTAEVVVSVEIEAPPARVFRALTEPELMSRWLGSVASVDLASGAYSYGMNYEIEGRAVQGGPTRILELVPGKKLVTDWPDWRGDLSKPKTHVTWELTPLPPDGRRTRLTLTHAGFAHPVERSDYQQGWLYFLHMVRDVAVADLAAPSPEAAPPAGA